MKLTFITHALGGGGAARSMLFLLRELPPEYQTQVHVPVFDATSLIGHTSIEVEQFKIPPPPISMDVAPNNTHGWRRWFLRLFRLPRLLRRIAEFEPDFVILNGFQNAWLAPFLGRKFRIVMIAREILQLPLHQRMIYLPIFRRYFDHTICITSNEQRQLESFGVHRTTVLFNSNDRPIASLEVLQSQRRARHGKTGDRKTLIGVFGAMLRIKGQHLVVEACLKHRNALHAAKVCFLIFGKPSALGDKVKQNGLSALIELPGWVDDIEPAMSSIDLMLRPDLTGSPWGRDIIEAMSRGIPVIASGTSSEFIKPGENGDLFPAGDVDAMVECILSLAKDHDRQRRYSENALQFAQENFDAAKNAKKFCALLETLKSQPRPN